MLDQQDKLVMEEIVERKTSDIRQDVSVLRQEFKLMREENQRNIGMLIEQMKHNTELIIESIGTQIKEALKPYHEKVFENHETRISSLELAVKKKTDLRLI